MQSEAMLESDNNELDQVSERQTLENIEVKYNP